jgi:nucleotide-binding universal stress UspA family protein
MSDDLFQRLLLATEHGEFDSGAEALAPILALRCGLPLAAVLPLASNPEFEAVAPQWAARAEAEAAAKVEQLVAKAAAVGVALTVTVRRGPEPYAEIVDEAVRYGADLIIIRRRGKRSLLANLLVGEMVSKVVAHAPCSVLLAPRGSAMWRQRVLVGLDPAAPVDGLLERALALAATCRLPLQVVCVALADGPLPQADAALARAEALGRAQGVAVSTELRRGRVYQALLEAAADCRADLIVLGRHRGDVLPRAWIGGAAQKVLGLATCPVLVHVPTLARRPDPS